MRFSVPSDDKIASGDGLAIPSSNDYPPPDARSAPVLFNQNASVPDGPLNKATGGHGRSSSRPSTRPKFGHGPRSADVDDTTPIQIAHHEWRRRSESPFDQHRLDIDLTVINGQIFTADTVISESPSMTATSKADMPQKHLKLVIHLIDGRFCSGIVTEVLDRVNVPREPETDSEMEV